jgi:FdrA protein
MEKKQEKSLIDGPLRVVNVGLESFARDLQGQGVEVVQVDWQPPAGGNAKLADLLSKLGT